MTLLPTKRPDTELAHLAWCIMVAVTLARREGKTQSPLQTHMFIMQWLSTAQKRKLFPKSLAQDIIWLQEQGKRNGPAARLYSKIEYIWLASSGELASQSTLFRFTCMIDTLRTMGWQDYLLSDTDWQNGWRSDSEIPAIYTQKSVLHCSFTEAGALIQPFEIRLTGKTDGIYPLLEQCRLTVEPYSANQEYKTFLLQPDKTVRIKNISSA
ncbi:DUF2913 family protein [Citrobacter sp. TSA-1]|uniref:DUF2913 family protein n=1 Tax=Citrobacter sp. TSA-1 TaxID=184912 RepID=UPI000BAE50F6|nr:DUF2913 family protein [Citrobacter sp. TSA-1]PAX81851.1 hypothetical protein CIK43_00050 [Citrobacter sp. TSA-1]